MFPLWDEVIEPVLRASGAHRVVEIGALRGENTVKLLGALGPDAELHVIDPAPEFDPSEHERAFAGRYEFHRGLSIEVLPGLPPVDVAIIDGDHNYYTVSQELRLLADRAQRAGADTPLLILHDVGWPYGRRDLYYAPDTIPDEHRHEHARAGMRPGSRRLLERGGLNQDMDNAVEEGGPRNGVMTALDDFIADHDEPLRCVIVPIYYGLAVVAEEGRLARNTALASVLDRLESAEGRRRQAQLAENIRLRAAVFDQNVLHNVTVQLERSRAAHLGLLKDALLDRHYLENEVRLAHLSHRVRTGRPVNVGHLRDPVRYDRGAYEHLARERFDPGGPVGPPSFLPHASMGRAQLDHLHSFLDLLRREERLADIAEFTTDRAGASVFARRVPRCPRDRPG